MNTQLKNALSLKTQTILALVPISSLLILAMYHDGIITGTKNMYGFATIPMMFLNILGLVIFAILRFLFVGSEPYPNTLINWISIILLNWIALVTFIYSLKRTRNSKNVRLKRVIGVLCLLYLTVQNLYLGTNHIFNHKMISGILDLFLAVIFMVLICVSIFQRRKPLTNHWSEHH